METLRLSPRFFTHELKAYSQWETAFWRELLQNSVDANATEIQITLENLEEGKCQIDFNDNGVGMNEDILRNVYFNLGETSKGIDTNSNTDVTIGGHGRARVLTCFAHQSYQIKTLKWECSGQGGEYQISLLTSPIKGCQLRVITAHSSRSSLEYALRKYLETCQLQSCIQVEVQGERFTNWLYKRKATRIVEFGSLHTSKRIPYRSIVRVNGVAMFENYLCCADLGIILEIPPEKSRNILTVSRDQLKSPHGRTLDTLLIEIAIDSESIKRDSTTTRKQIYGRFKKPGKEEDHPESEAPESEATQTQGATHRPQSVMHSAEPGKPGQNYYTTAGQVDQMTDEQIIKCLLAPTPQAVPKIPYILAFEDATPKLVTQSKKLEPGELGGVREKILIKWDQACGFFLQLVQEMTTDEIRYLPGFIISPSIKGSCGKEEGGYSILINPFTDQGKLRLSCKDTHTFFSLAAHECAHVLEPFHNESYASVLTTLTEKGLKKFKEFKTLIN